MFMGMMFAMQCNPVFKATYQRLMAAGKPKMVVMLNAMVRDGQHWSPKPPQ